MDTARDLCRKILEATGTVGLNQPIEGAQLEDTLAYLNMELTILNNQNAFKPFESVFEKTISSGKSEYTIGSGGDIDLPRPISISWMKVLEGNTWYPMTQSTQMALSKYASTQSQGSLPRAYYYESVYPMGVIGFNFELGITSQYKIAISHEVQQFGLNDEVALPEGYYPLLLWGTVSRLPDVPRAKKDEAKINYSEILSTIKSQNTKSPRARSNYRTRGNYNVVTDCNE